MRDFEIWDATPPAEEPAECGMCNKMKMEVEDIDGTNVCEDCHAKHSNEFETCETCGRDGWKDEFHYDEAGAECTPCRDEYMRKMAERYAPRRLAYR